MIFLNETEGLVRIYDREWQCYAEENNPTSTTSGLASPLASELPSLEAFRISASPTTIDALPTRQLPSSAIGPPSSPHKRRKTADSYGHSEISILTSPVVERSNFLAQYSPAFSHHSAPFPISPSSVAHAPAYATIIEHADSHSSHQQIEAGQGDAETNYAVSPAVQSPTYLELPA